MPEEKVLNVSNLLIIVNLSIKIFSIKKSKYLNRLLCHSLHVKAKSDRKVGLKQMYKDHTSKKYIF